MSVPERAIGNEEIFDCRTVPIVLSAALDGDAIVAGVDRASGDQIVDAGRIDPVGVGRIRRAEDADTVDGDVAASAGDEVKHRAVGQRHALHEHARAIVQGDEPRTMRHPGVVVGIVLRPDEIQPEILAVSVDRSRSGDGDVVAMLGRNVVLKPGFGHLQFGGIVAEENGRSGVKAQIEIAVQREGRGEESSAGDDDGSAAGFGAGRDGVAKRVGVKRFPVADGAEIGDRERLVRNRRSGDGEILRQSRLRGRRGQPAIQNHGGNAG